MKKFNKSDVFIFSSCVILGLMGLSLFTSIKTTFGADLIWVFVALVAGVFFFLFFK